MDVNSPSNKHCCVFDCTNSYKNTKGRTPPVTFYSFPTRPYEKERFERWIRFAKRINPDGTEWRPKKHSFICSVHFFENVKRDEELSPSYVPTIYHGSLKKKLSVDSSTERYNRFKKRRLTNNAPTTAFVKNPLFEEDQSPNLPTLQFEKGSQTDSLQYNTEFKLLQSFESTFFGRNVSTYVSHTIGTKEQLRKTEISKIDVACGDNERRPLFLGFHTLKYDESRLKGLTSVRMNVFSLLLNLLPPPVKKLNELSQEDKLLLFLMKLKLGIPFTALSSIFGIHRTTTSRIFFNILQLLSTATKNFVFWPSKSTVEETMPPCFKTSYSNCRIIIDCTEFKTERPPEVFQQVLLWSSYKNAYTLKYLIGITPGGFISFVSRGYGGRSTDSFVTNDSGFLSKLEPGDVVMADKGFPHITFPNDTVLVMPPFSNPQQQQFSEDQMEETYKVASVRIHVERMIQRIRIYNILNTRIPIELISYMDDIVSMCSVLANLQPHILDSSKF